MRLIDADKLIALMRKQCCALCMLTDEAIDDYANKRSEDVQPVVHAKWIVKDRDVMGEMKLKCNHCNGFASGLSYPNYCPSCGARMEGKE